MTKENPPNLNLQIKVSKILSRGFVFSIVWLAGIGSLIAIISGIQALRLIKKSQKEIVGTKMAWWCIIVGSLGILFMSYYFIFH